MKKKLFSLLMMVAMVLTALLPAAKTANAAEVNTAPEITTVNVHKVLMKNDDFNKYDVNKDYDPNIGLNKSDFGEGAEFINGVYFVAVSKTDTETLGKFFPGKTGKELDAPLQPANLSDVENYATAHPGYAGKTEGGQLSLKLPKGDYYIYEVKGLSTYKNDKNKAILAKMKAVPIEISLPYSSTTTPGKYLDTVNVYPKNTEEGPKVEKTVQDLKKLGEGVDIGEVVPWYLQITLPEDIADYKVLKLTDTLANGLEYVKNSAKAYIVDSTYDGKEIPKEAEEISLTNEMFKVDGQNIAADFAPNKVLNTIVAKSPNKKLVLKIETRVTKAAMQMVDNGDTITNQYTLTFGHNPDSTLDKPSNTPEIYSGGVKFKKVDEKTNEALPDAKFLVQNNENKFLITKDDAEGNVLESAWVTVSDPKNLDQTFNGYDGYKLKVYSSDSKGFFEIKGLSYGKEGETMESTKPNGPSAVQYKLYEVVPPKGYAIPSNPVVATFDINKDSYKTTLKNPLEVNNRKQDIPQTGGIGTVVFTAVGLLLMVTSFVALRRRASHSK